MAGRLKDIQPRNVRSYSYGRAWPTNHPYWRWAYSHRGCTVVFVERTEAAATRLAKYWGSK